MRSFFFKSYNLFICIIGVMLQSNAFSNVQHLSFLIFYNLMKACICFNLQKLFYRKHYVAPDNQRLKNNIQVNQIYTNRQTITVSFSLRSRSDEPHAHCVIHSRKAIKKKRAAIFNQKGLNACPPLKVRGHFCGYQQQG